MALSMYPIVFALILVFVFATKAIKIIRPFEKGLIERFGKYQRTVDSGLQFIIPFIETIIKVDIREQVIDVPPQEVITKDNAAVTVDAVIYFEVTDPFKVVYNVARFELAALKLAQTNLRNLVGDMELDETLTSRETINGKLRMILDDATDSWGVRVTRVELQKIEPPRDITDAMSKQMKAERTKRAAILEAEGIKQSEILRAEGSKQSAILEAQGRAEAIRQVAEATRFKEIAVAEGQAKAIMNVYSAIHKGQPSEDLIAIKYLEALEKVADGKATKIFLPMEVSGILSSIAGVAEIFKEEPEARKKKLDELAKAFDSVDYSREADSGSQG